MFRLFVRYAEYCVVEEQLVMPVPANMTTVDAAAIPEVWLTAFQLLHLVAHIKPNDYVLIHAGGSGVGTAATQLAVAAGAVPIVGSVWCPVMTMLTLPLARR